MKKIKNILMVALVCMLVAMPVALTGCFGGGAEPMLEIFSMFKTEYYVGEELDLTGGMIEYTDNGDTYYLYIEDEMVEGFRTDTVGKRKMVISYERKSIIVEYIVSDVLQMKDKTIYCASVEAFGSPNGYILFYIDRVVGEIYTFFVDGVGSLELAASQFDVSKAEATDFSERIIDGKRVVVIEGSDANPTIYLTPNQDGTLTYMVEGAVEGLGEVSITLSPVSAEKIAEVNAMPKLEDKDVYYLYNSNDDVGPTFFMFYVDREEGEVYHAVAEADGLVDDAVEAFLANDLNSLSMHFSFEYVEKIENGKRIITGVIDEGLVSEQQIKLVPKNSTQINVTVSYEADGPQENTLTLNLYIA